MLQVKIRPEFETMFKEAANTLVDRLKAMLATESNREILRSNLPDPFIETRVEFPNYGIAVFSRCDLRTGEVKFRIRTQLFDNQEILKCVEILTESYVKIDPVFAVMIRNNIESKCFPKDVVIDVSGVANA